MPHTTKTSLTTKTKTANQKDGTPEKQCIDKIQQALTKLYKDDEMCGESSPTAFYYSFPTQIKSILAEYTATTSPTKPSHKKS